MRGMPLARVFYLRRRNKPARTRSRNGVDFSVVGAGFRFGFALAAAACFAALRASSFGLGDLADGA